MIESIANIRSVGVISIFAAAEGFFSFPVRRIHMLAGSRVMLRLGRSEPSRAGEEELNKQTDKQIVVRARPGRSDALQLAGRPAGSRA